MKIICMVVMLILFCFNAYCAFEGMNRNDDMGLLMTTWGLIHGNFVLIGFAVWADTKLNKWSG